MRRFECVTMSNRAKISIECTLFETEQKIGGVLQELERDETGGYTARFSTRSHYVVITGLSADEIILIAER